MNIIIFRTFAVLIWCVPPLVQSWIRPCINRHSIRLRSSALYVSGSLHGRVIDSVFTLAPILEDLAPHLSTHLNSSTPRLPPTSEPVFSPVSESVSPTSTGTPPLVPPLARPSNQSPTSTVPSPASLSYPVYDLTARSPKRLQICLLNCRSLVNQRSEFQSYIYTSIHDVLVLTETWLAQEIPHKELLPTGFTIYCNDRPTRGGGVLIALNYYVPSKLLTSPLGVEVLIIDMQCKPTLTFCVVYIPPNSNSSHHNELLEFLNNYASTPNTFILGDFNYPDISWKSLVGRSEISNAFSDFVHSHNLSQLVTFHTYVNGNTLDLILTMSPLLVNNLNPCDLFHNRLISDHFLITFSLSTSFYIHRSVAGCVGQVNYSKLYIEGLTDYLFDYDFALYYKLDSVESLLSHLKKIIRHAISLFAPSKKYKPYKSPVWFNTDIRHKLHILHSLRKKQKRTNSTISSERVASAELSMEAQMTEPKSKDESKLVNDLAFSNSGNIYSYLKSFSKNYDFPPPLSLES